MSRKYADWDKIEETYLAMKEQELEQVDMPELWSRIEKELDQNQDREERERQGCNMDNGEIENNRGHVGEKGRESKENEGEKEVSQKNGKRRRGMGRNIAAFGTLVAAVLLVLVSYSVMRSGVSGNKNGERMFVTGEENADVSSQDSAEEGTYQESTEDLDAVEEQEADLGTNTVEDSLESNTQNEEGIEEDISNLLCLKIEDGVYEFSVNLKKYCLQLVEISVKNEENMVKVTFSDFASPVQEKLQAEIEDITTYVFYVDSEGVLYMEKANHYYQIHLEEKGDGGNGE